MKHLLWMAGAAVSVLFAVPAAQAEPLIYGVQIEQLEHRYNSDQSNVLAWDGDALIGTDELKFVLRSEGEFETKTDKMESMETQARLQTPISTFFDGVVGVRFDTPDDDKDRTYGVVGVHGLAPQWFEIDADLFISDKPKFRVEAEYEALITNYLILTPSIEFDLPLNDDTVNGIGRWGPKLEVGARLSYDLIDRAVALISGCTMNGCSAERRT